MNPFLKAKHWQLFVATFGLTLTLNLFYAGSFLQKKEMPAFYSLLVLIPVLVNLCWLWSIGTCLQRRIPKSLKMNQTLFRLLFLILTGEILFTYLYSGIWRGTTPLHLLRQLHMAAMQYYFLIIPAVLLAAFCLVYCFWFAARTIKTAELHRATRYSDFSGTFLAFFFYPMGIWNLQSRINRLSRQKESPVSAGKPNRTSGRL